MRNAIIPFCTAVIMLAACQNSNNKTDSFKKEAEVEEVDAQESEINTYRTNAREPIHTWEQNCNLSPQMTSGGDIFWYTSQKWRTSANGERAYVVGIMKVGFDYIDSPKNFIFTTPILEYNYMDEETEYRIYDKMEAQLQSDSKNQATIAERCCWAFTNYPAASKFLHLFENNHKLAIRQY